MANAVEYFQRSLTEHRTPDVLNKLRAAEKAKRKAEIDAYLSPEKAEEARELGSQKFKEADWPAAVESEVDVGQEDLAVTPYDHELPEYRDSPTYQAPAYRRSRSPELS